MDAVHGSRTTSLDAGATTPYAFVEDVAASWEHYERFAAALESVPAGLIVHVAGPTDEGFRIIELWESEDAWESFRQARLPAGAAGGPRSPEPVFRGLRPAHVVCGAQPSPLAGPAGGTPAKEESPP